MSILDTANDLNDGHGLRLLTEAGRLERERRLRDIGHRFHTRPAHLAAGRRDAIERELFAPENEGVYWTYATATPAMRRR